MKRCPQCEFIYEDDQSLCDMDGVLLVLDSRTLPNLHALATVEAPVAVAPRAHWRQKTFPAMAALILATVLSLVYFVTNQRGVQSAAPAAGTSITAPTANPVTPSDPDPVGPQPTDVNGAAAGATLGTSEAEKSAAPKPQPTKEPPPPAAKKTSGKTPTTQNRTAEPKKDDSKVNSILKKTGRILKKPFKF